MVGQELNALRDTVVTLGTGPEVLWTTGALCRVYEDSRVKGVVKYSTDSLLYLFLHDVNLPVSLLISPSEQAMQSKQQTGSPFLLATRVPGEQLSLHTDRGGCRAK